MNKYFHEFTPGFNWVYIIAPAMLVLVGINPPIRGSIEQDNALFENYNHKR